MVLRKRSWVTSRVQIPKKNKVYTVYSECCENESYDTKVFLKVNGSIVFTHIVKSGDLQETWLLRFKTKRL